MIYFDTNVVVYALEIVRDDERLIAKAKSCFDAALDAREVALSFLTISEMSFVLAKLKVEQLMLEKTLGFLSGFSQDILIDSSVIRDFLRITKTTLQYRHSFDILHIEIARRLNCHKIVTCDREFKKLQSEYHDINIEILT